MQDQYVTIQIAGSFVYAVQKTDGSRYASAYSWTEAVKKADISIRDFLAGNSPEASPYKGSVYEKMKNPRGNKPMNGLPLEVGVAYWYYQARKGNKEAQALVRALSQEAIETRMDGALGITTTIAQVEERTTEVRDRIKQALDLLDKSLRASEEEQDDTQIEAEKAALFEQMTEEEFQSYVEQSEPVWAASRARREAKLPEHVQMINRAITQM